MIIVTRQTKDGKQVLCHGRGQGQYWGSLLLEKVLDYPNARQFPSSRSASKAADMMGGAVEVVPDPRLTVEVVRG